MSTIAPETTHPITAGALGALEMGKSLLLSTFKHVPDDRLNWAASPTSKSALRIVAHCAVSNYGLAGLLRGEPSTINTFKELREALDAEEAKFTSREQVVAAIEESSKVAREAIAGVDPATFGNTIGNGDLAGPTTFYMNLIGMHMSMHAAQIDYIQTCWGDLEPHFGG